MRITLGGYIKYSEIKRNLWESADVTIRKNMGNQQSQPTSPVSSLLNLPAVKLSISEEGMESWREAVREQQNGIMMQPEHIEQDPAMLYDGMVSYDTMLSARMATRGLDYRDCTLKEKALDLTEAYGKLYDEITRGYETGQRVAYVEDPESEDGLRRVTLEEELAGLNEAFEKFAGGLEKDYAYFQKSWEIKIDYKGIEIRHATGARREQLLREREEYENSLKRRQSELTLPENTKEKLISATQEFIAQYLKGNGGSVSQILASIQVLSEFRR